MEDAVSVNISPDDQNLPNFNLKVMIILQNILMIFYGPFTNFVVHFIAETTEI